MSVNFLLRFRNIYFFKNIICHMILRRGCSIPKKVQLGNNVLFPHNSIGTVIHPNTIIGDNVKVYQNVTIGRADIYNEFENSKMKKIIISDGAILCARAKILSKEDTLIVGKNTIIGANSVLLNSTGDNEVWVGIPAKRIK